MCNPMRLACPDRLEIGELARYPLISQTGRSALQATVEDHFRRNNVAPTTRLSCNSLSAISGLALGGLGIGTLPIRLYLPSVASGELKVIELTPELPPLESSLRIGPVVLRQYASVSRSSLRTCGTLPELARPRQQGL